MTDLKPATSRAPTTGSPVRGRRPRHRPVKQSTIWVHRWLSLVLGLFLVLETSSGSIMLYRAEIDRHVHRADYAQGVDQDTVPTVSYQQAIDAVTEAHPKVTPTGAYSDDGTILVYDDTSTYSVDPRSGAVLGDWAYTEHPGAIAWTLTAAENIHFCFFSCKGDPLYLGFMAKTIPHTAWLGGFDADINVATLTLGILAILLVFLSLSGVWLWWPTIRHFKRGVRVRFKANRYARDYDLHQVVGMIAIPLLLMWGLTGMSLEYGWFAKAYYAAAPGSERTVDFTSAKVAEGTEDIGYDAAVAAAQAKVDTTQQPVYYSVPAADDATAVYDIWFSHGFDPWTGNGNSGGDLEVLVDRHDASRSDVGYGSPQESLAQHVFQDYNYTLHGGLIVHSWLRIVWLVLGLTPLLLMWTGISTWLFKRAVRARRRDAVRARTAAVTAEVAAASTAVGSSAQTDPAPDTEARRVVMTGVWVSGARCIVQYVLAPGLGLAGFWVPWLSQLVQILACLVTVSGALRLHAQHDRRRHLYAAIAVLVLTSTVWTLLRPLV